MSSKNIGLIGILVYFSNVSALERKTVAISRMSKHHVAVGYSGRNEGGLSLHKLPKNHKKIAKWSRERIKNIPYILQTITI